MKPGRRCSNRSFMLCKNGLVPLIILRLNRPVDELGKRSLAERIKSLLELLIGSVKEKTKCSAPRCGIVYHFRHQHVILPEIKLIANPDLPCRVNQNIPEPLLTVQLAKQEHLYLSPCLLLVPIKPRRKNPGVVEYKHIMLPEIFHDVFKHLMFNLSGIHVHYHQPRLIPVFRGIKGNQFLRKGVLELR
ncbi:MAG: hypothetical protein BWY89_01999 [Bacteroidetes bacterium ADurb.BinA012]|nr:MAG: hypothetical protein BWY89_01999 [Bacteroidetes bacterium ADurb.BinA012]